MKQSSKNRIWQIKFILALAIVLITHFVAFSQNNRNLEARKYAADFFNLTQQSKTGLKSVVSEKSLTQSYQSPENVKTSLFVFQRANKGFAMVAKSNNTFKIVGYSDEENFQTENIPPQLRALMTYYEDSLQFINPLSTPFVAGTPVVPALLDKQGIKLNQFGHQEFGGCPTGCVATAVTQVMLYHEAQSGKPIKGYGSHCYTDSKYGELCADFENADYNSNDELLSLHVGQAMEMQYCGDPHGSIPNRFFGTPLWDHFKYIARGAISEGFFIKNELEHERPLYITLPGDPVGHAFVIDGYDDRDYYHVNFGWGGYYNGYYLLNSSEFLGIQQFKFFTNIRNIVVISPTVTPVNIQDSLALVAVHNALGGFEATNWDLTTPVWKWRGVLTMNDRVIRLTLAGSAQSASAQSIAPEIGNLTALRELHFSGYLNGTIPSTISKLTELRELSIINEVVYIAPTYHTGNLKGELPSDIDKLTLLESLYIANSLEGIIPTSIGNLENLKYLNILQDTASFGKGNLTGPIPGEIGNLGKLRQFSIIEQRLNGKLPETINNLTELTWIDLSGNQLSGSIPSMNLPRIMYLTLSDNVFSEITAGNGNCPDLTYIYLQNNQISGKVPSSYGNFSALKYLNLSDNLISSLPNEVGNLIQLESFLIDNNQLEALPDGLALNLNLKDFSASNNQIKYIPSNFAQSGSLETLDLSYNQITSIPTTIGDCPNLHQILLNNNRIDSIPASFANISNVAAVLLHDNEIQGKIPENLLTSTYHVRLDYNRFVYDDIPKSDELKIGVREQKDVLVNKQLYMVQIGDTVSIDVRTLTNLRHPDNEYYWVKYPEFIAYNVEDARLDAFSNNPILEIIIGEETLKNKYCCQVFNSNIPSYSFEYDGSTHTFPSMYYLNTDTIAFKLASDVEIIADKHPEEYVTSLGAISDKTISDGTVTLVPPVKIKRGEVYWEASADGTTWERISETMERTDLKANVKSESNDKLILIPKNTAYYRCCINETDCDPIYSDKLKVNALGNVLFDEIINVSEESLTIDVDSIEVVVPINFYDSDFRMTITKLDNPPTAPDSVKMGSAYEVSVSFADEFKAPLLIKLKNIDKNKVAEKDIDKFKAVYFDDLSQKWKHFEHASLSLKDSTINILTNHLTKLSYWWDEEAAWGFTDYYGRNNILVFYKENDIAFMNLDYPKNQSPQPWHISSIPLVVQDITEYLPKIMEKYKKLGIEGPNGRFRVYIQNLKGADGNVGILSTLNGYITIGRIIDSPNKLRQALAHEFMHYTQDYYIATANGGNTFWLEANATLSDRMVWDNKKIPICESEQYLAKGRTSTITFNSLANSWDYYDVSFFENKYYEMLDNKKLQYYYQAGTFLHYMRSYREKKQLEPAILLKETTWLDGWRSYLESYISKHLDSNIGDEYEDFVKYILSGVNENFTLINKKGNPYVFIENNRNSEVFTYPVNYHFKEGDEVPQKNSLEIKIPDLAAKVVMLENLCSDTLVLVNYKRKHNTDDNHIVYYATYDYQKKEMTYVNISDSTEYNFLLDARNKENTLTKFKNYSFLLLINKRYDGLSSNVLIKDFEASFELTATPVLSIESVGMLSIYNGDSPIKHNFDDKSDHIIIGQLDAAYFQYATGFDVKVINNSTSKQIINDHIYQIKTQYTFIWDQGQIKGMPTQKDSTIYTQTIENDILSGTIKITEQERKFRINNTFIDFVKNAAGEVIGERLVYSAHSEWLDDNTKTYWLKDFMNYMIPDADLVWSFETGFGKNVKYFKTNNTAETKQVVTKIEAHYKRKYIGPDEGVFPTFESRYLTTDFSNPNLWLNLIIRTSEE